MLKIPYFAKLR